MLYISIASLYLKMSHSTKFLEIAMLLKNYRATEITQIPQEIDIILIEMSVQLYVVIPEMGAH